MEIINLKLSQLKNYEKNARKHADADVETIMNSIKEFGFNDPVGIWSDQNIIVEGHGRVLAAKKLKMKEVPCIRLDHLTDEQRRAYALAHNKTAEMSEWDVELLESELSNITDIDMSSFGFTIDSTQLVSEPEEEEAQTEKLPESKLYIFAISAFGTDSETFVEVKLGEEEAEKLLEKIKEIQPQGVADVLRRALNDL